MKGSMVTVRDSASEMHPRSVALEAQRESGTRVSAA